jgi:hypothetical protein
LEFISKELPIPKNERQKGTIGLFYKENVQKMIETSPDLFVALESL